MIFKLIYLFIYWICITSNNSCYFVTDSVELDLLLYCLLLFSKKVTMQDLKVKYKWTHDLYIYRQKANNDV